MTVAWFEDSSSALERNKGTSTSNLPVSLRYRQTSFLGAYLRCRKIPAASKRVSKRATIPLSHVDPCLELMRLMRSVTEANEVQHRSITKDNTTHYTTPSAHLEVLEPSNPRNQEYNAGSHGCCDDGYHVQAVIVLEYLAGKVETNGGSGYLNRRFR